MVSEAIRWAGLREAAPRLASEGERLLSRDHGPALLVTVRGAEALPRDEWPPRYTRWSVG